MLNVTNKAGPQPVACPMDDCARAPWNGQIGEYCKPHKEWFDRQNGTAATPPIIQLDDPELLEREAEKAKAAEELEYRERRRVKTWKVLEDGRRVPEEYWSDEELAAIEAEVAEQAQEWIGTRGTANETMRLVERAQRPRADPGPSDPVKDATKFFKACLRGKKGKLAETLAWSTLNTLGDIAE